MGRGALNRAAERPPVGGRLIPAVLTVAFLVLGGAPVATAQPSDDALRKEIASIHPQAHRLHEAAHCAGDQGRYWEMHDRLFEDPQRTEARDPVDRARALGLDASRFERSTVDCLIAATCLEARAEIYHNDRDFDAIARVSGLSIHRLR